MGGPRCTIASTTDYKRVPHTFHAKTTFNNAKPQSNQSCYTGVSRNDKGNRKAGNSGCARTSKPFTKLHLKNVSGAKERRLCSSNLQFKGSERLCSNHTVQIAEHVPSAGFPTTARLAVQGGLIPGLFPPAYFQESSEISKAHLQGSTHGNDLPTVRAQYSTKNICLLNELDRPITKRPRSSNNSILRRLSSGAPGQGHAGQACKPADKSPKSLRFSSERAEVTINPPKEPVVFRRPLGPVEKSKVFTSRQSQRPKGKDFRNTKDESNRLAGPTQSDRSRKLCEFCCSKRSLKLQRSISVPEFPTGGTVHKTILSPRRSKSQSNMVVSELPSCVSDSCSAPNSFLDNGRIRSSVGRSIRPHSNIGTLDLDRSISTLQLQGDVSCSQSFTGAWSSPAAQLSSSAMRQQDCCIIYSKRGGNSIFTPIKLHESNFSNTRLQSDKFDRLSSTRQVQCTCRPSVETSTSSRMAPTTTMYRDAFQETGDASSRSVCFRNGPCLRELCFTRPERSQSVVPQCIFSDMALLPGVDISTTISDPQGTSSPEPSHWRVPDSLSSLGTRLLESGLEGQSISGTVHNTQSTPPSSGHVHGSSASGSPQYDAGSMDMWGWSKSLVGWNDQQLNLLKSSWRSSTLKTYKVAWARWSKWSQKHKVNALDPSASQVAQFLSDLYLVENLSYNTILLHKSVVSTLTDPKISNKLSSDPIIQHVLKAISLKRPTPHKLPVWNIDTVVEYLRNPKDDPNITNFIASSRTAMLLLLCSGRRVHDLTLLRVDSDHYKVDDTGITLWPAFGSKTDCSKVRQSGWRLLQSENKNLDPVFWIKQTVLMLKDRRDAAGCSNLFISTRGKPKAASRAIIAGWIKTLLTEAGINATPGSVRSAVASRNWLDNFPLDDILARGNWRSGNTFAKFYRREVLPANSVCSITNLFRPDN